jgi:hypothetical protein
MGDERNGRLCTDNDTKECSPASVSMPGVDVCRERGMRVPCGEPRGGRESSGGVLAALCIARPLTKPAMPGECSAGAGGCCGK